MFSTVSLPSLMPESKDGQTRRNNLHLWLYHTGWRGDGFSVLEFRVYFLNSRMLHRSCIYNNVRKLNETKAYGTSKNRNQEACGRPRTETTAVNNNIQQVRRALQQNPKASARSLRTSLIFASYLLIE